MKKAIVLIVVLLLAFTVIPAHATKLGIKSDGSYWGMLSVTIDSTNYRLGSGRFHTQVLDDQFKMLANEYSYCVDIGQRFRWYPPQSNAFEVDFLYVTDQTLPMADGDYLLAAQRVYNYDAIEGINTQVFNDVKDYSRVELSMAVQLSVWEAVYGNLAYTGDNEIVRELYDRILKNPLETLGFWDKAFVVAVSGTHQDQLVPNPVPEPGTMMLMGTSLIGLGVFGRRKIKK